MTIFFAFSNLALDQIVHEFQVEYILKCLVIVEGILLLSYNIG